MDVKKVKLGTTEVEFPSDQMQPLQDCNHLLGDRDGLWKELNEKGYLLIRGFHSREEVLQARLDVLKAIKKLGPRKLDGSRAWEEGVLDHRCDHGCIPSFQGRNDITHSEAVSKVLEGPRPYAFFKTLFGEDARTFDYKWLRAVHRQAFTGAHVDNVYMARGTSNLLTMWTPFGDVDPTIGCLASGPTVWDIYLGELADTSDMRRLKRQMQIQGNPGSGWFTTDPFEITERFGGQWKTSTFQAGDVLIFGMKTVHMSTANLTDLVRISCDTRWQPAKEPADGRYVGDLKPIAKFGLHAADSDKSIRVTMEELKAKWGFQ